MITVLSLIKERRHRLFFHVNVTKIFPLYSSAAMNGTFHLLSLRLVLQYHPIFLGKPTSTPLLNMHLKLGFLSRARGFFSSSQLLTIYKSQIRPSLDYCSHVWSGAPRSSLHFLDKVQSIAIHLTNNPSLTKSLQSLSLIVVWLQICPFSIDFFMYIAHWKPRVLFLIP